MTAAAMTWRDIVGSGGGKGGGGGSSATEAPDSLHSISRAKILDLISTGEIVGPVNGLQSIMLNGTPIQNPDGSMNFQNVTVDFRPGTQMQEPIAGFPSVENELGIGVELKADTPWVRSITNTQLSAVRVRLAVAGLSRADTSNGNISGYRIDYVIDVATDNGSYVQVLPAAFNGKTTQTYERSHRIELPKATIGWTIRVRRITPNANSNAIADRTNVVSITEVIDAKFRYPMAALLGIQLDASQFQSIPVRSAHMYGRIVRVPTNYDAATRAYSGPWDGTFKVAYTNNPAWVLYDLLLHPIYGLGRRITAAQIDQYELYRIAQYCDQLVSDGRGGLEPRFTCNVYIQQRVPAYKLIQDIAAIFHGKAFWGGGRIIITADMPDDPVYTYTAANVIDGKFARVGSASTSRYTVALVSWNDNTDGGKQKVEPVVDRDGLRRYGVQQVELAPIGCTSQSQAHRHGQWAILTSNLEKDVITFSVGLEYLRASPGKIIRVLDPARTGRRNAGRILTAKGRTVTVDKAPVIAAGDKLTCILPNAVPETRIVASVVGDTVTVTEDWSMLPAAESIWSVDNIDLVAQKFRVLSVRDKGQMIYEITAIQHESGKYAYIDNGTRIESPPVTVIPPSVQPPPANVTISSYEVISQGIASSVMSISWAAAPSAIAYLAEWKKDDGNWISLPRTGQQTVEVPGIYAGTYNARVRAINPLEVRSAAAYATETQLTGKTTPPPTVTSLLTTSLVFGIGISWGFPAQGASDTQRTEIWISRTPDRASAIKLGDFAYPQNSTNMMGLAAGTSFFFWARLVDRSGNEGEYYPAGAGVNGQSSSDQSEYEKFFLGQINESALGKALQGKIDSIGDLREKLDQYPDGADVWSAIVAQQNAAENLDALAATQLIASIGADKATSIVRTVLGAKVAANEAKIESVSIATADALGAMASKVDTVEASAGSAKALAQQSMNVSATTDGKLAAMYNVKMQVQGPTGITYAAGFGLGIENNNGVYQSQFAVSADRFIIVNANGTATMAPFVVQGGQVFMNQALIGTAWITTANIANAAITSAKIGDAAITNAKIADAAIDNAKIGAAAITNAKIGSAAVDTLTIAGNAVTQTSSAIGNGNGVLNLTVTTYGGPIQIIGYNRSSFGGTGDSGANQGVSTISIWRDGALIAQNSQGGGGVATAVVMYLDYPQAGVHTYTATMDSNSKSSYIGILETKR